MTNPHIVDPQADQAALLSDPRLYGPGVAEVERIDTHGARVYLGGNRVLKLKRAVDYPYMDLSTVALRERACREELVLNRRTAAGLYRGVAAIVRRPDGTVALMPDGPALNRTAVIDWVVDMNRFDQDRQLDRLASDGRLDAPIIDALADGVAGFHAQAAPVDRDNLKAMGWVVRDNAAELKEMGGTILPADRVADLVRRTDRVFERHRDTLAGRTGQGWVRRCHGDLHLRNIVLLEDGPAPFDAIDFNDALAEVDTLYDLAFLIMDLDFRGFRAHANRLFARYLVGLGDLSGLSLLPLYLAVRATVRAKIAASLSLTLDDRAAALAARREAAAYLDRAIAYLEAWPARLIVIGGLSGTGKTTVARALAPDLDSCPGALHLRSDAVRKALAGVAEETRLTAEHYTGAWHTRTFETLHRYARTALQAGRAVVLDGVYGRPADRHEVEALARSVGVPFQGIWLEAKLETRVDRVSDRAKDASDADAAIAAQQAGWFTEPVAWPIVGADGDVSGVAGAVRAVLDGTADKPMD